MLEINVPRSTAVYMSSRLNTQMKHTVLPAASFDAVVPTNSQPSRPISFNEPVNPLMSILPPNKPFASMTWVRYSYFFICISSKKFFIARYMLQTDYCFTTDKQNGCPAGSKNTVEVSKYCSEAFIAPQAMACFSPAAKSGT